VVGVVTRQHQQQLKTRILPLDCTTKGGGGDDSATTGWWIDRVVRRAGVTTTTKTTKTKTAAARGFTTAAAAAAPASSSSPPAATPGLFSIPGLNHPSDFLRLAKQAIHESDALRSTIPPGDDDDRSTASSSSRAVETLYLLDQISKTVCNVIDAAELCRSAHASPEWREAADRTFAVLQDYIGTLNTDRKLYNSLSRIMDDPPFDCYSTLTEEEQRFCSLLKREFELDGIHLPDEERQRVRKLHNHVTTLESLFMSNITHHSQKKFWVDAGLVETVLPRHVLQANGAVYSSSTAGPDGGGSHDSNSNGRPTVMLTADTAITHSIASFAPDGKLRREVYMETMTSCPENLDVLDAMIDARDRLARSLGFESYGHRFLQDKMAKSPDAVSSFLRDLQTRIQPSYRREMELLGRAKQQVEGSSNVEPWDVKFYVKLLKAQGGVDPNELAPYLSLSNCLNATRSLVHRLFGIRMEERELEPGERWDVLPNEGEKHGSSAAQPRKEERIRKFVLFQEDGKELGLMYLDLHPRPGKYTHAAHFTVRCGCRVNGPNSDFQTPIVALVCNMNTGQASFSSHAEVETFLHEFGHALHSLLSRTNFQHLSGTRAAMDFVETPSHWMEHYAWDAEFLPLLATNARGEVIPDAMKKALAESRNQFRFLEMQNQIVLAKFDQVIFGPKGRDGYGGNGPRQAPREIWAAAHRENGVPFAAGTHWFTNVGHLVTYGAGYYGYLYSQVFASAIWNQLFHAKSMQRESGEKLWKKLLRHGGARDANVMLEDLLGHKPTVENYWRSLVP
jgi:mitochondrial intermediate peptidase